VAILLWNKPISDGRRRAKFSVRVVGFDVFQGFRYFMARFPGESWWVWVGWVIEVRWGRGTGFLRGWDVSAGVVWEVEVRTKSEESTRPKEAAVRARSVWGFGSGIGMGVR